MSIRTDRIVNCYHEIFQFRNDSSAEHELIRKSAIANGAFDAVVATHWSDGGAGAENLASALIKACDGVDSQFKFLYELDSPIEEKISRIAREMYGAANVDLNDKVKDAIKLYTDKVSQSERWEISKHTDCPLHFTGFR